MAENILHLEKKTHTVPGSTEIPKQDEPKEIHQDTLSFKCQNQAQIYV